MQSVGLEYTVHMRAVYREEYHLHYSVLLVVLVTPHVWKVKSQL